MWQPRKDAGNKESTKYGQLVHCTIIFNVQITKQKVDRFCIFHDDLPKCELSMQWSTVGSPPERLVHKIDLAEGTANSRKYFSINFDPVGKSLQTNSIQ